MGLIRSLDTLDLVGIELVIQIPSSLIQSAEFEN